MWSKSRIIVDVKLLVIIGEKVTPVTVPFVKKMWRAKEKYRYVHLFFIWYLSIGIVVLRGTGWLHLLLHVFHCLERADPAGWGKVLLSCGGSQYKIVPLVEDGCLGSKL